MIGLPSGSLFHERSKGPLLLLVDGEQLPAQVRVEAVPVDLRSAVRDGGVEELDLLTVAGEERGAGILQKRFPDPGQARDRGDVLGLRALDFPQGPLAEEASLGTLGSGGGGGNG